MMTLLQMKVPVSLVVELQKILDLALVKHAAELEASQAAGRVAALNATSKAAGDKAMAQFNARQEELRAQGHFLTMQNLLRVAFQQWLSSEPTKQLTGDKVIELMKAIGTKRGRPNG